MRAGASRCFREASCGQHADVCALCELFSVRAEETVPGHATMFGFEPKKMEYEVVDIGADGQITAMTAEGQEKFFFLPEEEHGPKLLADFQANAEKGGDAFYVITVLYCPRMVGKKWMANMYVESYKLGGKTD